mmetsp:Transcript_3629/g.8397  ORF Transcript_3629/g.8397 Transcript_3629/m.8397 type:complete len:209 (-) Transcript_3629:1101-1727(-)
MYPPIVFAPTAPEPTEPTAPTAPEPTDAASDALFGRAASICLPARRVCANVHNIPIPRRRRRWRPTATAGALQHRGIEPIPRAGPPIAQPSQGDRRHHPVLPVLPTPSDHGRQCRAPIPSQTTSWPGRRGAEPGPRYGAADAAAGGIVRGGKDGDANPGERNFGGGDGAAIGGIAAAAPPEGCRDASPGGQPTKGGGSPQQPDRYPRG